MDEVKRKLNVVAVADGSVYGRNAVAYGELLSRVFDSSLTVVLNFQFKKRDLKKRTPVQDEVWGLKALRERFVAAGRELTILEEGCDLKSLQTYAEGHNTALFVIGAAKQGGTFFSRKAAFRFISPMRQPVMVVGSVPPPENAFKNVLLPIDIQPQSKEKMLWAGYFNRFYQATIHILHTTYKDEVLQKKIIEHKAFAEKLYSNLEISDYHFHNITPTIDNMDRYSLQFAPEVEGSLTVIMMTLYKSLGDILLGVREKKLIANDEGLPVLAINPREDLYVLCT